MDVFAGLAMALMVKLIYKKVLKAPNLHRARRIAYGQGAMASKSTSRSQRGSIGRFAGLQKCVESPGHQSDGRQNSDPNQTCQLSPVKGRFMGVAVPR